MNPTCWRICPNLDKHLGHSLSCPEEMLLAWWPLSRAGEGAACADGPSLLPLARQGGDLGSFYK